MKCGLLLLCALFGACTRNEMLPPPNAQTETIAIVVHGAPLYIEDNC